MTHWEIEAMKREAVQVRNDWTLSDKERAARLSMIAAQVALRGGNAEDIVPAEKRSTRNSRAAATRRKA